MNPPQRELRIMAIVVRSQRLGFAVLEGALGLLDWRIVYYQKNEGTHIAAAKKKVAHLIHFHEPSVVVLCRTHLDQAQNAPAVASVGVAIKREAARHFIPVMAVRNTLVRDAFSSFGVRSKEGIASMLASMFPELAPKLPPKRKIWHGEHAIMPMFDAVALAVACWDRHKAQQPQTP